MIPLFDRFNAKVDRSAGPNGCWPYTGHRSGIHLAGTGSRLVKPQRIAWMQANGPIPEPGIPIGRLPSCTPTCCNPTHLTYGVYVSFTLCGGDTRGWKNGMSKLTDDDVRAIRSRCAAGELQRLVGADFGIKQAQVSHICLLRSWRHIA